MKKFALIIFIVHCYALNLDYEVFSKIYSSDKYFTAVVDIYGPISEEIIAETKHKALSELAKSIKTNVSFSNKLYRASDNTSYFYSQNSVIYGQVEISNVRYLSFETFQGHRVVAYVSRDDLAKKQAEIELAVQSSLMAILPTLESSTPSVQFTHFLSIYSKASQSVLPVSFKSLQTNISDVEEWAKQKLISILSSTNIKAQILSISPSESGQTFANIQLSTSIKDNEIFIKTSSSNPVKPQGKISSIPILSYNGKQIKNIQLGIKNPQSLHDTLWVKRSFPIEFNKFIKIDFHHTRLSEHSFLFEPYISGVPVKSILWHINDTTILNNPTPLISFSNRSINNVKLIINGSLEIEKQIENF